MTTLCNDWYMAKVVVGLGGVEVIPAWVRRVGVKIDDELRPRP
jgi:hypothetical protein